MKTFAFYKKVGKDKTEITVYRIMRNKPVLVFQFHIGTIRTVI